MSNEDKFKNLTDQLETYVKPEQYDTLINNISELLSDGNLFGTDLISINKNASVIAVQTLVSRSKKLEEILKILNETIEIAKEKKNETWKESSGQ